MALNIDAAIVVLLGGFVAFWAIRLMAPDRVSVNILHAASFKFYIFIMIIGWITFIFPLGIFIGQAATEDQAFPLRSILYAIWWSGFAFASMISKGVKDGR